MNPSRSGRVPLAVMCAALVALTLAVSGAVEVDGASASGNGATVIIENNRQPGLDWLTVFMTDNNGQERVISLPDRIRNPRLVTINQVKLLLVRLRSLMRERRQCRSQLADNPLDGAVTGWCPVVLSTDAACFAVDVGDSSAWLL